ncbi:Hypothetical predicted protein [Paramuricea clavata]|uniref:Uncharacterized protein n=1 Tax=Paramuricea clavata TaxID=317549 RepID=A0A6S7HB61_PARCT|nr:Hypothetical predicted protein [Paramuricea clavata]
MSQNGKFKLAQQQLGEKALDALYKIRKNIDFRKLTPKLAMKIFDSIISPILLYNSEIWGAYKKTTIINGRTQKSKDSASYIWV